MTELHDADFVFTMRKVAGILAPPSRPLAAVKR